MPSLKTTAAYFAGVASFAAAFVTPPLLAYGFWRLVLLQDPRYAGDPADFNGYSLLFLEFVAVPVGLIAAFVVSGRLFRALASPEDADNF